MKIKTVKKMNLPELIQHVWDNGISYQTFHPTEDHLAFGEKVFGITVNTGAKMNGKAKIHLEDADKNNVLPYVYYVVEVEEELTEETEFDELWEVYYNKGRDDVDAYTNGKVSGVTSTSISKILKENSIDYENIT